MSLLYNVMFSWKCTSTHHKLALDALRHLRGEDAERWTNLFLSRIEIYLSGSKAPDKDFKDFRNHVLHVGDNNWGGAVPAAQKWYERTVQALRQKKWADAVYSAGVMSHYITDPFQPFHTAQSEEETRIHRAAEWSIAKSYEVLQNIIEQDQGGYPELEPTVGPNWLEELIVAGATEAHTHYDAMIEHYDLKKGVKNPPDGLDQECKDRTAKMIGLAAVAYSRALERALAESEIAPPSTPPMNVMGVLAGLTIPIFWVTKSMANREEKAVVHAMYKELQKTGKVRKTLPEDDRVIRRLHAEEVLGVSVQELDARDVKEAGAAHGLGAAERPTSRKPSTKPVGWKPAAGKPKLRIESPQPESKPSQQTADVTLRFYLNLGDPVVDAPSIGPQTAERLEQIGVRTVDDLLNVDPLQVENQLQVRHIDAERVRQWQEQARFVLRVPELRGHDAQILVGCGIATPEDLVSLDVPDVLELVNPFVQSADGQRIIRSSRPPDEAEVTGWIASARQARPLDAA